MPYKYKLDTALDQIKCYEHADLPNKFITTIDLPKLNFSRQLFHFDSHSNMFLVILTHTSLETTLVITFKRKTPKTSNVVQRVDISNINPLDHIAGFRGLAMDGKSSNTSISLRCVFELFPSFLTTCLNYIGLRTRFTKHANSSSVRCCMKWNSPHHVEENFDFNLEKIVLFDKLLVLLLQHSRFSCVDCSRSV